MIRDEYNIIIIRSCHTLQRTVCTSHAIILHIIRIHTIIIPLYKSTV